MARIRSIKPEFWVSEQIAECSTSARLTFVGLWNFADDNGVHPAKPKTLKAELYPMDDISAAQVGEWMGELIKAGLVRRFEHDGEAYWHVTGWARHQKIDRPSCKYPTPPGASNSEEARQQLGDDSTNARRAPPPGVDRIGEDRKDAASPIARLDASTFKVKGTAKREHELFGEFYAAYPRHEARADAAKAFGKLNPDRGLLATLVAAIKAQGLEAKAKAGDVKFVPYPATWLNGRRWEDDASGHQRGGSNGHDIFEGAR